MRGSRDIISEIVKRHNLGEDEADTLRYYYELTLLEPPDEWHCYGRRIPTTERREISHILSKIPPHCLTWLFVDLARTIEHLNEELDIRVYRERRREKNNPGSKAPKRYPKAEIITDPVIL